VMLLSDDRNLPMPLQKTQISTISFGHSVGTGRTGVRPAPDVPRGCPPHSFLRQEGPANPSAANFPVSSPSAIAHARNARAAIRALASSDTSSRRRTMRSRLCGKRGPTYVRANSAASSSVRTVTSRARDEGVARTRNPSCRGNSRGIIAVPTTCAVTRMFARNQFRHYFEGNQLRWRKVSRRLAECLAASCRICKEKAPPHTARDLLKAMEVAGRL
jgi:hypothetical protein